MSSEQYGSQGDRSWPTRSIPVNQSADFSVVNPPGWLAGNSPVRRSNDPEYSNELKRRQGRLQELIQVAGLHGFVTMKQPNMRYLSGYSTIAPGKAALAVTLRGVFLAVSESELGRALQTPNVDSIYVFGWDEEVDVNRWLQDIVVNDKGDILINEWEAEVKSASHVRDDRIFSDISYAVDELRIVKSDWEIERIRRAADATKAGVAAAFAEAHRKEAVDADVAAAAMTAMTRASGYEFPATVVVGVDEGAGIAHSPWQRYRINGSSTVFLEFSGGFDGYCAPVMRTMVSEASLRRVQSTFRRVEAVLDILYSEIQPGARCADIASKCTAEISDMEGILFHYNYGYPVGIFDGASTWMNGPAFYITEDNDRRLEEGMVFHLPIVFRRFGQHALGQSQTILVTGNGVDVLTGSVPSGLLVIPS